MSVKFVLCLQLKGLYSLKVFLCGGIQNRNSPRFMETVLF
jgi:hypothetical protein